MYKEQIEIIGDFENILTEKEAAVQLFLKKIIDEVLNNKGIFAIFFECIHEYSTMNIMLYVIDDNKKLCAKKDIANEINRDPLFSEILQEREDEVWGKYEIDEKSEDNDQYYDKYVYPYHEGKKDLLINWVGKCWDTVKKEFNNIPQAYFSMGDYINNDGGFMIDLNTKEILKNDEQMKLKNTIKRPWATPAQKKI